MNPSLRTSFCGVIAVACVLTFFPAIARADVQTIRGSDKAVWAAAGGSFFNYKEPASAPDLPDSEHGWVPSVAGGISDLTAQNLYLALEGSFAYGDADYNGAFLFAPTVPLQGTTREAISTVDGKLGQAFALGNSALMIPYVEVGFRYWNRNLGGDQAEDYRNFDTLGGLMLQISPANRWILSAYGAAGTTFGAQARAAPDTFDLGSAAMYKTGAKIGYDLTQKVEVFTIFDYDHFSYGQSAVAADSFFEPDSRTGETAFRLGLGYHFN